MRGVDFSQGLPDVQAMVQAGVKFACLYVGYTSPGLPQTKIATKPMVDALKAAGIVPVSNWEWDLKAPTRGYNEGSFDATTAAALHQALGGPASAPIYFSVDYGSAGSDVVPYFQGIKSVLPTKRIGVYGSYACCKYLLENGYVSYTWQFVDSQWLSAANIRQVQYDQNLGGKLVDYNESMTADFGQWGATVSTQFEEQAILDAFLAANTYMQHLFPNAAIPTLRTNTGIFKVYHDLFVQGIQLGAATTDEYTSVTGTGGPITYQNFGSYRIGFIQGVGPNAVYGPTKIALP